MPYIKPERRKILDPYIDALRDKLAETLSPGDMNYAITRLVAAHFLTAPNYSRIAEITGVLENVKQEFCYRVQQPYENLKDVLNGDIREYATMDEIVHEGWDAHLRATGDL